MRLRGRGAGASAEQEAEVAACVAFLENDGGVSAPAESPLVEGDWTLLYTSKSRFDVRNPLGARVDGSAPGLEAVFRLFGGSADASAAAASSSPIQRSITGNDAFTVTQTVALRAAEPMVDNTVCFGASGKLLLRAAACVSESADRRRIDFRFDGGYFETADLPVVGRVRIPYPVPFKLLGDEAKGWLDTTYLSARVRISRGNKVRSNASGVRLSSTMLAHAACRVPPSSCARTIPARTNDPMNARHQRSSSCVFPGAFFGSKRASFFSEQLGHF